jgi:hypothetical protein
MPFREHLVVLLQVASGSAAVPATAHRRFHVEKKQRRGLPVILLETIVRRRCAALIPYARRVDRRPHHGDHTGSTYDNRANLAPAFLQQIVRKYEGTRLGRQELNAEILDDVPGALWSRALIEETRWPAHKSVPDLIRITVAIDPAASSGEEADETGIVVAGKDADLFAHAKGGEWDAVRDYKITGSNDAAGNMTDADFSLAGPNLHVSVGRERVGLRLGLGRRCTAVLRLGRLRNRRRRVGCGSGRGVVGERDPGKMRPLGAREPVGPGCGVPRRLLALPSFVHIRRAALAGPLDRRRGGRDGPGQRCGALPRRRRVR